MVGKTLGHYEIIEPLGAGGMGEVYRARDTSLERDVAIKVLPEDFAADADRLARFEREAKLLAQLNHANIATIHGLEDADGVRFIAMECVEGETLSERLAESEPIELVEVLEIARQVAEALEAAHESGIVHRDLKPANVKVTAEGKVKVLDFGLAKRSDHEAPVGGSGTSPELTHSPTMLAATRTGVILGTAAYMSPEQARGKPVDQRADIWAFGCLVYELLARKAAFAGDDVAELLVAVMTTEPDWEALPDPTPDAVRRMLRRCLQKDPRRRLRHIGDAGADIEDALAEPDSSAFGVAAGASGIGGAGSPGDPESARVAVVPWAVAALATTLAVVLGVSSFLGPGEESASWSQLVPPESTSGIAPEAVLSPDGESVVFRARNASGETTLWLRRFDAEQPRELRDTADALLPFWSPDGRSIAFFDFGEGTLKRLEVDSAQVTVLAYAPNPRGGSWNQHGEILYAGAFDPLHKIPDSGDSDPVVATKLGSGALGHIYPYFLPDGRRFLYAEMAAEGRPTLYVGSLDSTDVHRIEGIQARAEYVDGQLLFADGNILYAQGFDADRAELEGDRVRLAEGLGISFGELQASFSARLGKLVYANGGWFDTQLVVIDREGRRVRTVGQPGEIYGFTVPPSVGRVAIEQRDTVANTVNIYRADLDEGIPVLLAKGNPWASTPHWSKAGDRVMYNDISGNYVIKSVGEPAPDVPVDHGTVYGGWLMDWSADGKHVVFQDVDVETAFDIWVLPLEPTGTATPYLNTTSDENEPQLSPDDRWLAYSSDAAGEYQVYVSSFPQYGFTTPISLGEARKPMWGADSTELYYISGEGMFVEATLAEEEAGLRVVERRELFSAPPLTFEHRPQYAVLDGGEQFVFNEIVDSIPRVITIITNWKSLLEDR